MPPPPHPSNTASPCILTLHFAPISAGVALAGGNFAVNAGVFALIAGSVAVTAGDIALIAGDIFFIAGAIALIAGGFVARNFIVTPIAGGVASIAGAIATTAGVSSLTAGAPPRPAFRFRKPLSASHLRTTSSTMVTCIVVTSSTCARAGFLANSPPCPQPSASGPWPLTLLRWSH